MSAACGGQRVFRVAPEIHLLNLSAPHLRAALSSEESLIRMDLTKQVSPGIRGDVRRMRRTEGSFRVAPEIHLLNLSAPHLRGSSPHLRRALFVWI